MNKKMMAKLAVVGMMHMACVHAEEQSQGGGRSKWLEQLATTGECEKCNFANQVLTAAIKQAREAGKKIKLKNANLTKANVSGADLSDADLHGAKMNNVEAEKTNFSRADLGDVRMHGANVREAQFDDADLTDAEMRQANVRNATFKKATMAKEKDDGSVEAATFEGADISGADFTGAKGLDHVSFKGARNAFWAYFNDTALASFLNRVALMRAWGMSKEKK